ncbi:hypothetical protein [Minwuia sp.]|uniref:hypothetical protein n=1 Tax=Minwuia sp. TaxID=2493630 RepID=UPI003A8E2472
MKWTHALRRTFSVLLLAAMLSPLLINGAFSKPMSHHAMMGHEVPADAGDQLFGNQPDHERMACSIFVPCDHGFCVGMALLPPVQPTPAFLTERYNETADSAVTLGYAPTAPPPKHIS